MKELERYLEQNSMGFFERKKEEKLKKDYNNAYSMIDSGGTERGIEKIHKLAQKDNHWAQLYLGRIYLEGKYVSADKELALKWYLQAAEKGHAEAQFQTAELCVEHESEKAKKWYEKADKQGHPQAAFRLGMLYENRDKIYDAEEWYEKAEKQGHPEAAYRLAVILEKQMLSDEDAFYHMEKYNRAYDLYEKAEKQGYIQAASKRSLMNKYMQYKYYNEEERDWYWYYRAMVYGRAKIAYELGDKYRYREQYRDACDWYKEAMEQGNPEAAYELGIIYKENLKEYDNAFSCFEKGAKQGSVNAMCQLGTMYLEGKGTEENIELAKQWYEKLAEQKHEEALFRLAGIYEREGNGEKAIALYDEITGEYKRFARVRQGIIYEDGIGIQRDYKKAAACYRDAKYFGIFPECGYDKIYRIGMFFENRAHERGMCDRETAELFCEAESAYRDITMVAKKDVGQFYKLALFRLGQLYENGWGVVQFKEEAARYYEKAAGEGHEEAMYRLGLIYEAGVDGVKNAEMAACWYEKAIQAGCVNAWYHLGILYENGNGVQRDVKKAVELLQKAVEQGHADAQYKLAMLYLDGKSGVIPSEEKGMELLQKAVKQNQKDACYQLALLYSERGNGIVEENPKEAVRLIQKLAECGHVDAQYKLGQFFELSYGMDMNYGMAEEWYQKAAKQEHPYAPKALERVRSEISQKVRDESASQWYLDKAEQGNVKAQTCMVKRYYEGKGVEKNKELAREWCEKSIEQGDSEAMCLMADYFYCKEDKEYLKWYEKAADHGFVKAQEKLVLKADSREKRYHYWMEAIKQKIYPFGTGVYNILNGSWRNIRGLYDKEMGTRFIINFCKIAATEYNSSDASWALGMIYSEGRRVEQDDEIALMWYTKAAQRSDHAMDLFFRLAEQYEEGKYHCKQNFHYAAIYYEKAAQLGNVEAQYKLGSFYEEGKGVEKNIELSFQWYEKAAHQGNADAQFALSVCYKKGRGIEENEKIAWEWCEKAAEQGNLRALARIVLFAPKEKREYWGAKIKEAEEKNK